MSETESSKDPSEDWRYLPPRNAKTLKAEEYIQERVFGYRKWYDDSAVTAKFRYQLMRAMSVVGAAVVPVLINIDVPANWYLGGKLTTSVISLLVVILVSLESVYHYGDQWKNYRSTEQYLAQEYFHFTAGEGVYRGMKDDEAFLEFVDRIEGAIASENASTLKVLTVSSDTKGRTLPTSRDT